MGGEGRPSPAGSDSVGLAVWGGISVKLPGDAAVAGLPSALYVAGAFRSQTQDDLLGPSQALGVKENERHRVLQPPMWEAVDLPSRLRGGLDFSGQARLSLSRAQSRMKLDTIKELSF